MSLYHYRAKLERVVDGDTIICEWIDLGFSMRLHDQNIRLYGLDTPESRTRDKVEKIYGNLAKQFLIDHVPEYFTLRTHKDGKGKYGRILGSIITYVPEYDAEMDLNQLMIKKHLGVAYHGQSKDDIEAEHLKNRTILQERGIVGVTPDYR